MLTGDVYPLLRGERRGMLFQSPTLLHPLYLKSLIASMMNQIYYEITLPHLGRV